MDHLKARHITVAVHADTVVRTFCVTYSRCNISRVLLADAVVCIYKGRISYTYGQEGSVSVNAGHRASLEMSVFQTFSNISLFRTDLTQCSVYTKIT
jgi:hypothetical protein